jgi:3-deoxy-7-phosphoheptulonate synthase
MSNKVNNITIIGPCSLESLEQMEAVCALALKLGIKYIRAQAYKPRTRPESFQGLGVEGAQIIKNLKEKYPKLAFVSEVCSLEQLEVLEPVAQVIQIGARNMQNFELLKAVGKYFKNDFHDFVLLKRGFANTLEEWLAAADYLISGGIAKDKIILCERGSRSLTSPTGVSLDFICAMKAQTAGFKVIVDPSHGSRDREYVLKLAAASLAMDFDGLMLECHPDPKNSVSDAAQALSLEEVEHFFK